MSLYHDFTSARVTTAHPLALLTAVRAAVSADVGIREREPGLYRAKKNTDWTAPQIAAAQQAIDTAPADTPQLQAQQQIDALPLFEKAAFLTILDRLNALGARVNPSIAAATPAQFLQAIKDKAGALT